MESERYATAEHECPRSQALAVTRPDLDEPVGGLNVVNPTVGAKHPAGRHDARGQRAIEPFAVEDCDLLAGILELCDATAGEITRQDDGRLRTISSGIL